MEAHDAAMQTEPPMGQLAVLTAVEAAPTERATPAPTAPETPAETPAPPSPHLRDARSAGVVRAAVETVGGAGIEQPAEEEGREMPSPPSPRLQDASAAAAAEGADEALEATPPSTGAGVVRATVGEAVEGNSVGLTVKRARERAVPAPEHAAGSVQADVVPRSRTPAASSSLSSSLSSIAAASGSMIVLPFNASRCR